MSMNVLNEKIKVKLETLSGIQVVYPYPTDSFDGYPAATITPSDVASDYETSSENLRTYAFVVRIFVSLPTITQDSNGNPVEGMGKVKEGYRIARVLVDSVIDLFDKDETMSGISLPVGKTIVQVKPAPSAINYYAEQELIVAEVKVDVLISFDVNS